MFLPPEAFAGLPCAGTTRSDHINPYAIAVQLAAQLAPPDLQIKMNPAKGLVRVPTWFWVEGYDGRVLSDSKTALETHEECRFVVSRDDRGQPMLDADRMPRTRRQCRVETTTFVIDVRLWPRQLAWDFGDQHGQHFSCRGQGECGGALGQAFVDMRHPSPVQHPYVWTSLGANGLQDAYTISLGITFGAEYRVSVNGSGGGWQGLPDRGLSWMASHQVREAQAVLTRP
jgi:hypothetical protein